MVILHISNIGNNTSSGMSVVIPEHVYYQSKFENVALLNLNENEIINEKKIKVFKRSKINNCIISNLEKPYCKPDIIVFHGIYYIDFIRIQKIVKDMRIPYVLVPHGCLCKQSIERKFIKKKLAIKFLLNKLIFESEKIQFLSQTECNTSIGENKGIILPNGIDIKSIKSNFNLQYENKFKLIYVGRLSIKHKGLDLLLKACNCIKDFMRDNNIELNIYGPDSDNEKYKLCNYINKNKISDLIKINNPIFGEEKLNKIIESDVFVQTSRWEGQPVGLMEAMAYSKPVIVTYGTNMGEEILENNCGWVSGENYIDISENIKRAFYDKENIYKKGKNSRELIMEKYNWNTVAKSTLDTYRELLGEKR